MDNRVRNMVAIAAVAVALILGVLLGVTTGIADRIFGGPNPKTIASASLQSMRAQNRLIAFVARYVSVVSSEQERLGGLVSSAGQADSAFGSPDRLARLGRLRPDHVVGRQRSRREAVRAR